MVGLWTLNPSILVRIQVSQHLCEPYRDPSILNGATKHSPSQHPRAIPITGLGIELFTLKIGSNPKPAKIS